MSGGGDACRKLCQHCSTGPEGLTGTHSSSAVEHCVLSVTIASLKWDFCVSGVQLGQTVGYYSNFVSNDFMNSRDSHRRLLRHMYLWPICRNDRKKEQALGHTKTHYLIEFDAHI
jgi:hypothetical protein